ncbi:MAG: 2-oxoglutarate dehydrogenase E1 component [Pseudomonadota bacterium]|nr:2-oxoglutarate dehydrogenase E1 component [Pseudomonadota bacterium]
MSTQSENDNMVTGEAGHRTAFLDGANAYYIEQLYEQYLSAPESVDRGWKEFFDNLGAAEKGNERLRPSWEKSNWPETPNGEITSALDGNWGDDISPVQIAGQIAEKIANRSNENGEVLNEESLRSATIDSVRAIMMIRAYRARGHLAADLDPLGLEPPKSHPELEPESYGFTQADYDRKIFIDYVLGLEFASIREMLEILKRTYCGRLALEFMHISDPDEKSWLQERMEGPDKEISFTPEGKKAIFSKLVEAEGLEKFIDVKYTGTKRFGLDGAESIVPALEQIIKRGGSLGVKEIVIGMPHRGRLNVLTNVMSKPFRALFSEFKGGAAHPDTVEGSGDVKYHLGTSSDREFDGNKVHLSLTANPSHLEAVDPVVLGKARAKQDTYKLENGKSDRSSVIPLLLHGDAAFAGQGIVAECFGLSGLVGHKSGGSIHFIVNNQIGFTTNPRFSRSSPYPSDVAKMVEAPIFHVNGDDPEAVVYATKVATEFRQKFLKPVVIDMFCYRRFGHNEGDEPAFTQPLMYARIKEHPSVVSVYGRQLVEEGLFSQDEVSAHLSNYRAMLETEFESANEFKPNKPDWLDGRWSGLESKRREEFIRGETGVDADRLRDIGERLTSVPDGFNLHKSLTRQLKNKQKMFETGQGFDWSTAEALAFGSLMREGFPVRLSGQDSERGTFSQRHSVWTDQQNEDRYKPLQNISDDQGSYEVINSMLSEAAVLGFEYGYSLAEPNALVLWEAQFGDFANGAQVMVDQFISSSEAKWLRMSGLVMLLPHGYEGQGPEHSSARLERYLQSCAEENMQVANVTTPANYFHILRRQLHRNYRKPLILMTPKSLLRHKECISSLEDMSLGSSFHRVFWDNDDVRLDGHLKEADKIRRVVMCSGKVYYDLSKARNEAGLNDVYIMRIEQLYPYPETAVKQMLSGFPQAEMIWCQEEPKNMGAWTFIEPYLEQSLLSIDAKHTRPVYSGRVASASTATGLMARHQAEMESFMNDALGLSA